MSEQQPPNKEHAFHGQETGALARDVWEAIARQREDLAPLINHEHIARVVKYLVERAPEGQVDVGTIVQTFIVVLEATRSNLQAPTLPEANGPAADARRLPVRARWGFRRRPFLWGLGSVLEIHPAPQTYLPDASSAAAIRQDWEAVGGDLWAAIHQVAQEAS